MGEAEEKAVRKTVGLQSVQRAPAVGPLIGEGEAIAADDLVAGPAGVTRANLEASSEDDTIHRILGPVDHDAVLRNAFDPFPLGINQGHVQPVEGGQVFIVEAGPLAELPVPRLESGGGGWIGDDVIDPSTDLIHLLKVEQLHQFALFLGGEASA